MFCLILSALLAIVGHAQENDTANLTLGHEWIDYSQSYYVVKVVEDGLYKVTTASLAEAGMPPSLIQGDQLIVYHLGKEQSIYTTTSETFMEDDYILFYGQQNRGELDASLYENQGEMQLNPLYSLYSDTSYYYITLSESTSTQRWETVSSEVNDDMPLVPYYWHKETVVYQDNHFKPIRGADGDLRLSQFDVGEGFGSNLRQAHELSISADGISSEAPPAKLTIRHNGNDVDHSFELSVNDQLLDRYAASGYGVIQKEWNLEGINLSEQNKIQLNGQNGTIDKSSIAYIALEYPRQFNFEEIEFTELKIEKSNESKRIEIQSNRKAELFYIVDLSTNDLISVLSDETGQLSFPLSIQDDKDHQLLIAPDESIKSLSVSAVAFDQYDAYSPDYIILTHARLSDATETGRDEIQAYADYRRSPAGGGHDVLVVDVEQLYHQFSYGIQRHPLAIKHFSTFASDLWGADLSLFIIGKGREYYNTRTAEQITDSALPVMQVPTYGYPGSDNLLLAERGSITPLFASGRLAAKTPTEVKDYLDKVISYESSGSEQADELWRKRVLHLSGGSSDIQDVVFTFLEDLNGVISESQIGADVITFKKTSTAPIQPAESQEIIDEINQGVSMITFLGHSAPGTFDFSLEQPGAYDNEDALPILLSLGCHSGNIHSEGLGLSEDFVLERAKGSIAFIASSSSNYIDIQFLTGRLFYALMGGPLYNESIGQVMREALSLSETFAEGELLALNEQFTLHGDPAIRVYQSAGPDYVIESSSVRTEPAIISSAEDSITFHFTIINQGKYIAQDLSVRLQIEASDRSIVLDSILLVEAPAYDTQLSITLASPGISSTGKNTLYVGLNEDNALVELPRPAATENNKLLSEAGEEGYCFFILDNSILPLYPEDFAIVTEESSFLIASTANAFAEPRDYIFFTDTIATFDSPALTQYASDDARGMIRWPLAPDLIPNTVYYWKVVDKNRLDDPVEVRSFLYQPDDEPGWHQSHHQQLRENTFTGLFLNGDRQLQFDTSGFFISIHNRVYNPSVPPGYQFNFENFAASVNPWLFMESGVAVVIADPVSGSAWLNQGGSYGSISSTREASRRVFGYDVSDPVSRASLTQLLQQEVPDGHYVFLFTVMTDQDHDFSFEDWEADETSLIALLQQEGAALIAQLAEGPVVPYNFIYQKGRGSLSEEIAPAADGFIKTDVFIPTLATNGRMSSQDIGPAQAWGRVSIDLDVDPEDDLLLDVYGVNESGTELLLSTAELGPDIDLSMISADEYPYIRLEWQARDETQRTPSTFHAWSVYYTGLPDIALFPGLQYGLEEHEASDNLELLVGVANSSALEMGASEFKIFIDDDPVYTEMIPALSPGIAMTVGGTFSTQGYNERVVIRAVANPLNRPEERYQVNNIGLIEYDLFQDTIVPDLIVLFDDVDIDDGDIVNPTPLISIVLTDEAARRAIDDLSYFDIKLQLPTGAELDLDETSDELSFSSAQSDGLSTARISYQAELADGDYVLRVNATDAVGNEAESYERIFKVISQKRILDISVSPNPVSRQFHLNFFATGEFTLQLDLYDGAGRLIRSYGPVELGEVRGGANRSLDIPVNDVSGYRLPSGLYFYKLSTTDDGPAYDDLRRQLQEAGAGQLVLIQN